MAVNEQWVRDILRNNTCLINVNVVYVVNDVDAAALAGVRWLDDPHILLALMLLELLIVVVKVAKLIWQDVSVWAEVKGTLAEPFLQPHDIEAKTVLSRNFITLREVIDLLVLIESLILVALTGT